MIVVPLVSGSFKVCCLLGGLHWRMVVFVGLVAQLPWAGLLFLVTADHSYSILCFILCHLYHNYWYSCFFFLKRNVEFESWVYFPPTFFSELHTRKALSFKCSFNHLVHNLTSNQNRLVICEPCVKNRYLASLRK